MNSRPYDSKTALQSCKLWSMPVQCNRALNSGLYSIVICCSIITNILHKPQFRFAATLLQDCCEQNTTSASCYTIKMTSKPLYRVNCRYEWKLTYCETGKRLQCRLTLPRSHSIQTFRLLIKYVQTIQRLLVALAMKSQYSSSTYFADTDENC